MVVPCRSLAFFAFRHANPYGGFLLSVASLLSCLVGHRSDPYRTLIRSISDTVPDQTGHPSDPIGKLSDISPDDCPTSIGTLSALNRNAVRLQIGLVSGLRRNTQSGVLHPGISSMLAQTDPQTAMGTPARCGTAPKRGWAGTSGLELGSGMPTSVGFDTNATGGKMPS